jgi:hypothetical protein
MIRLMWLDLSLQVLNVGDGACSIVRAGGDELAVVDCGSWRSSGGREASLLASTLGRGLRDLDMIVVSHFDADHWRGLQALPSVAERANLPSNIAICYPGLPDLRRDTAAAYLAIKAVDDSVSVRALDLIDAWRAVAEVDPRPLFLGDAFELAGETFNVLWPPRQLPTAWSRAATKTLRELDEVAEGIPQLRHALDEAYEVSWPAMGQRQASVGSGPPHGSAHEWTGVDDLNPRRVEQLEAEAARDLAAQGVWEVEELSVGLHPEERSGPNDDQTYDETSESDDREILFEDHESASGHSELFGVEGVDFPEREALRNLARRLGVLNNHLSLVVASESGRLLMLGDLQGWSLRRLTAKIQGDRFAVALAPHHGTVSLPRGFPRVGMCILQNGRSHYERRDRHCQSHNCAPFSTEEQGHFAVPPWWLPFRW